MPGRPLLLRQIMGHGLPALNKRRCSHQNCGRKFAFSY